MDEMATQKDRTAHVALQRFKEDNEVSVGVKDELDAHEIRLAPLNVYMHIQK
jgi:hypothetical protein